MKDANKIASALGAIHAYSQLSDLTDREFEMLNTILDYLIGEEAEGKEYERA